MTNPELLAAAKEYHKQGIPVIPFKITQKPNGEYDKKNIGLWAKWQNETQTEEEFNALNWIEANGYAVILGTKAKNGHYLTVVDYDVKGNTTEQVKSIGKKVLGELPLTRVEKTVNGGLHCIYWNQTPIATDSDFHNTTGIELLGTKKLCLMAPSYGYTIENQSDITYTSNLDTELLTAFQKYNQIRTTEQPQTTTANKDNLDFQLVKIIDLSQLTKINSCEYQGIHPIHGSTTGTNFNVNTDKNEWHCFRHGTGGGPLQYLAMKEGIIKCEDSKKGALKGKKFITAMQLAVNQHLIDPKVMDNYTDVNPIIIAKKILQTHHFILDKETRELYIYNDKEGYYQNQTYAEEVIRQEIVSELNEDTRAHYHNDILYYLMGVAKEKSTNENTDLCLCGNGILNLKTLELQPYTPDIYLVNKIPHNWDPNATMPKIEAFNNQALSPQEQLIFQEFAGDCLQTTNKYKRSYLAVGPTDSMKTQHQKVLAIFLGENNISSHTIQEINHDRNAPANLYQKLANIADDTSSSILKATGVWKTITGGGSIMGRELYKNAFQFHPYAKFWLNCNNLPAVAHTEDDDSYYNRLLLQHYNNVLPEDQRIPNFAETICTPEEMSGFFKYAVEGLQRLRKQGKYSETMTTKEKRLFYIKETDPCKYFIENQLELTNNSNDYITQEDLHRAAVTFWQTEKSRRIPTIGELIKAMKYSCPGAQPFRPRMVVGKKDNGDEIKKQVSAYRYVIAKNVHRVQPVQGILNLPPKKKKNKKEKNENIVKVVKTPAPDAQAAQNRLCGYDCGNFNKPGCPVFTNHISKDTPIPLKCYGWKAPLPTEEGA